MYIFLGMSHSRIICIRFALIFFLTQNITVSDDCHRYVGRAVNSAYQNPEVPFDLGVRQNLVEQIRGVMEEMGKVVVVTYF